MGSFRILAGGYSAFIATYLFNPLTSTLSVANRSPTGTNPSWISQHPTNASILYAVNEIQLGALQSYIINSDGTLSAPQDTVTTGGDSPAFAAALSTGQVAVMNYNTGDGRIIPTTDSPLLFDKSAPVVSFPRKPNTLSHPHMVVEHGSEVFVPDLGQDTIWRLAPNASDLTSFSIQGSVPQPSKSGPRHIALFEDRLFTLHELSSTLTVQAIPTAPNGTSSILSSASIIPPNPPQGSTFAAAEILIPYPTKRFPTPLIYVSNRNTGTQDPRGDAITIFELVNKGQQDERLQVVNYIYTGLDQIRGMEFGPSEKGAEEFLIAAGVAGTAGTVVLRREENGRNMTVVTRNLDIPTRTSFVWV